MTTRHAARKTKLDRIQSRLDALTEKVARIEAQLAQQPGAPDPKPGANGQQQQPESPSSSTPNLDRILAERDGGRGQGQGG